MSIKIPILPTPNQPAIFQTPIDRQEAIRRLNAISSASNMLNMAMARFATQHPPTQSMLKSAAMLADKERQESVLIIGPSGTGKELIANIIAAKRGTIDPLSGTLTRHFYPVNCAGVTDTLFESILFGHRKGAFTGAINDNPGLLPSAGEGVVFMDEVGELPLTQQAKLLRVLQTKRVLPVGAAQEIPIHARFVFATNRNLLKEVDAGRFREDLFYRIAQFNLHILPLTERPGDPEHIANTIIKQNDWTPLDSPLPAWTYERGNVRQLQNVLLQREVLGQTFEELYESYEQLRQY